MPGAAMKLYLVGRNRAGTVEIAGPPVEAEDVVDATAKARILYGEVGVMPPQAVRLWMRRGAAITEERACGLVDP